MLCGGINCYKIQFNNIITISSGTCVFVVVKKFLNFITSRDVTSKSVTVSLYADYFDKIVCSFYKEGEIRNLSESFHNSDLIKLHLHSLLPEQVTHKQVKSMYTEQNVRPHRAVAVEIHTPLRRKFYLNFLLRECRLELESSIFSYRSTQIYAPFV